MAVEPVAAVGLIASHLQSGVRQATTGFEVRIEMSDAADLVVTRIETRCPPFVLIDTELLGCPVDLCRFARSLRADVTIVALVYFWSEREEALRACADAVLHKPPRRTEWDSVLNRLGVPRSANAIHAA